VAQAMALLKADDSYPAKPIEIVIPYDAGGGSDSFVRPLIKVIADESWIDEPFVVLNQPGGSGTIGSRLVKEARPDGYRILCHHESMITAELSGAADFGPADFEVVAQTGEIVLLIIVREDAPYETIVDLLEAAKQSPETIRFGANIGSPAHFTAMNLEAAHPGAKFNLVTSGGGQTRYTEIIGQHLDAGIFSLAEYLKFRSPEGTPADRNIRVLACLSEKPHPELNGVRTCVEQGVEVTSSNAYYWWAPKGTPLEVQELIASTLKEAMQHPEVRERLVEQAIDPTFSTGEAVRTRVADRVELLESFAAEAESELPNFTVYITIVTLVLLIVVVVSSLRHRGELPDRESLDVKRGILCLAALTTYVALLEFAPLPFFLLSALLVFFLGALICGWEKKRFPIMAEIALIAGLGAEFVFGSFFGVSLP
jgi:tripartite-type tricarboxylate transporter receptor subunit TctC